MVDDNQLWAIIQSDPRKTTPKVAEELNLDHSTIDRHLHQIETSNKLKTAIIFPSIYIIEETSKDGASNTMCATWDTGGPRCVFPESITLDSKQKISQFSVKTKIEQKKLKL